MSEHATPDQVHEKGLPMFTDREITLLLAAVYTRREQEPHDPDWHALYEKLDRLSEKAMATQS